MTKLACAFISLFFLLASPAAAADRAGNNWTVTQLSGDARVVHPGAQPASVKVNGELAPGDTLLTGPSGRATLVRGGDYIIVSPHSELRLPSAAQPDGFTRVIQNLGTMLFKVRHTGIPHFAVDTPMLAAVVKGTTFTVVVDQQRSAVQVIQGVVQVSTVDGAMSRMVEGGRTVFVNHAYPKMLLDADKPAPATGVQSSTSIKISAAGESPLAAISTLTGGLVRADLTVAQAPAATPASAAAPASPSQASQPDARTVTPASHRPTTKPVVSGPTLPVVVATNVPPAIPGVTGSAPPVTTPTVTLPSVSTPSVSVPSAATPSVTLPSITTPTVIVPNVSTGSSGSSGNSGRGSISSSNSGPGSISSSNSGPGSISSGQSGSGSGSTAITTPTVTVPSVTTPTVTVPSVTTPTATVPSVTTPTVTVPSITTPTVTVPSITTPIVTVPNVTVPSVSTPAITIPTVTVLGLKL